MAAIVEGSNTASSAGTFCFSSYQGERQLQLISLLLSDLPDFADLSRALYAVMPM